VALAAAPREGAGVIAAALLAAALGAPAFLGEYPDAKVERAGPAGPIVRASGFAALDLGDTCPRAATAFLERFGPSFGIASPRDVRPVADAVATRATFERLAQGLPVFDRNVAVQCDGRGAVVLVSAPAVPRPARARFVLSRRAAVRAALASLGSGARANGAPTAVRGWYAAGAAARPAWRVDVSTSRPSGAWRVYVDAARGDVLFRANRRSTAAPLAR
jgi:hypothetical protein